MQEMGKKPFLSTGKGTCEGLLKPHSPLPVRGNIVRYRKFAIFLLFSSLLVGQSIDTTKVATVHVYRQGRLLVAVSVLADGNRVVSLTPHQSATFYLLPGYHALTMQSGEINPAASFKAVAGKEYFFQLKYEHVVSPTSLRDLSMTLTMEPKMTGADELREVTIDQNTLLAILAQSNPDGLEPIDPILTNANATTRKLPAAQLPATERTGQ
jgi:hypothetical protein